MISHTCIYHGVLSEENILISANKKHVVKRCLICQKACKKAYYEKNKEFIKQRAREHAIKNKERNDEAKKRYRERNLKKISKRTVDWEKKQRENLADSYIKRLIQKATGLKYAEIPQELIDKKREIVKLEKHIKELMGKLK